MERRTLQSSAFVPPPQVGVIDDFVGVHRAMAHMSVYACVRLLADTIASLPWKAYRRDSNGVPKEINPQPALLSEPYPGFDVFQWKWMVVASMALRGNSYHYITSRDKNGIYPTALLPLHPDIVFLERRPDILMWFEPIYRIMGEPIPAQDMIHMRRFTMPGEPWGLSPIRQAAVAIGMGLAAEEYGYRYFKESANPSGTLSTDQNLDEGAITRLQNNWISSQGGRRLPAILTNGMKWETLSISPDESQFLTTRQFQRSEICIMYGVPPILIGDTKETTAWGCLPSSALVFSSSNGPVPISEINVGDEVWSFDGSKMVTAKVTGWKMTGYKPLLTIKTQGRELQVTENHRIPVRRYFGRAAGRIGGNPHRKSTCGWETIEISAGEIGKGDYLIVPHGMGDGDQHTTPNGLDVSVGMMEFLGLYLGDGNRDRGSRADKARGWVGRRVEIAHGRDEDHMAHYRQLIEREFGVVPYTDDRGTRTRFSSVKAVELIDAGFTGTAATKRVPGWVFRLAPELQLALLRGYLDADGSVQRGAIIFSSVNKLLLEDVRHLCIQTGVPVGKVKLGRKGGLMMIRGKTYRSRDKWELSLSSLAHNVRIGSNSVHKASRLTTLASNSRKGGLRERSRRLRYDDDWTGDSYGARKSIGRPPQGTVYHKVVSVERGTVDVPVYDIEVDGLAHYVADGIVVHNTGVSQINLAAVTYTFRPWTACIESVISGCLPRGQFVRFDYSALLRGDFAGHLAALKDGVQGSVFMPNEARAEFEMDPVKGGDKLYIPNTFVPVGFPPTAATPPAGNDQPGHLPTPPIGGGEHTPAPAGGKTGGGGNGSRAADPFDWHEAELRRVSLLQRETSETLRDGHEEMT
jgi:HK97 family phage portal protein